MRKLRLLPMFAVVCALASLMVSPAHATIMRYLEIEDLARLSSDIFHGQIVSTDAYWNPEHTRIYTAVRVRIRETFKGDAQRDAIVTVTQLGGERDGIRMDYAGRPVFATGESVVLFTTRGQRGALTVIALKQGKMNVAGNEITRDFSGLTLVDGIGRGKTSQPIALKATRLGMDELRTRLARTRSEGR